MELYKNMVAQYLKNGGGDVCKKVWLSSGALEISDWKEFGLILDGFG